MPSRPAPKIVAMLSTPTPWPSATCSTTPPAGPSSTARTRRLGLRWARDDVDDDAENRHEEDQDRPACFCPTVVVLPLEVVDEREDDDEQKQDGEDEDEPRADDLPERKIRKQHWCSPS